MHGIITNTFTHFHSDQTALIQTTWKHLYPSPYLHAISLIHVHGE